MVSWCNGAGSAANRCVNGEARGYHLMPETVLLCEAYGEVKSCLHVARESIKRERQVTVAVFENGDLFRFFREVNDRAFGGDLKLVFCGSPERKTAKSRGLRRLFQHLLEPARVRSYYRKFLARYFTPLTGAEVYFFTRYFNPYTYYLLKRLHKTNRLVFMSVIDYGDSLKVHQPRSVTEFLSLAKLKLGYGTGIQVADLPHSRFSLIPEKLIRDSVDEVISLKETGEILDGFKWDELKMVDSSRFRVIYFDQPLIKSGRVPSAEGFQRELNAVFSVLGRHFSAGEIAIKYHPLHGSDKSAITAGTVLEDYIPAELLYHPNIRLYLSFSSGSLANVEQGLAVSLLELVSFRDSTAREFIKETLVQRSRTRILFPKSLEELEDIIIRARAD